MTSRNPVLGQYGAVRLAVNAADSVSLPQIYTASVHQSACSLRQDLVTRHICADIRQ